MLKILATAFMSVAILLSTAGVAMADPNLPNIPQHRHFVVTPTGDLREVGPRFCDNAGLQKAFNQFHINVHHAYVPVSAGGTGLILSPLGPSDGAPGLHNDKGAELVASPCSFQP